MRQLKRYLDRDLLKQAQFLNELTQSLRSIFPTQVADHCWAGGIRDRTLVLITNSANWVVPIRYQQYEILKLVNSEFQQNLNRLKIKVVNISYSLKNPTSALKISEQSAKQIASTASSIHDPGLRSALFRLARRGKT
jgi:hypothetical protein